MLPLQLGTTAAAHTRICAMYWRSIMLTELWPQSSAGSLAGLQVRWYGDTDTGEITQQCMAPTALQRKTAGKNHAEQDLFMPLLPLLRARSARLRRRPRPSAQPLEHFRRIADSTERVHVQDNLSRQALTLLAIRCEG